MRSPTHRQARRRGHFPPAEAELFRVQTRRAEDQPRAKERSARMRADPLDQVDDRTAKIAVFDIGVCTQKPERAGDSQQLERRSFATVTRDVLFAFESFL